MDNPVKTPFPLSFKVKTIILTSFRDSQLSKTFSVDYWGTFDMCRVSFGKHFVSAATYLASLAHTRAGVPDAIVTSGAVGKLLHHVESENDLLRQAAAQALGIFETFCSFFCIYSSILLLLFSFVCYHWLHCHLFSSSSWLDLLYVLSSGCTNEWLELTRVTICEDDVVRLQSKVCQIFIDCFSN